MKTKQEKKGKNMFYLKITMYLSFVMNIFQLNILIIHGIHLKKSQKPFTHFVI